MKITFKNSFPREKAFARAVFTEEVYTEVVKKGSSKQLEIGASKTTDLTLRKLHILLRKLVSVAKANRVTKVAIGMKDLLLVNQGLSDAELGELLAVQTALTSYEYREFKSKPKGGWSDVSEVAVVGKVSSDFRKGVARGRVIAEAINATRQLSNTPAGELNPEGVARYTKSLVKGTGVKVKVLGVPEMEKLGMGGVLGVGKGSDSPPRFIIMEYNGGKKGERPMALVGKGITFDSGGLSLKPSNFMDEMHLDMSGASAVIHAVSLAARLGVEKNIVGLVPLAENMVSGSSYRPGDLLRTMSGKTIEVKNTDAEGRVVLSDGLFYAGKEYKPKAVIDVATLTGAAMVALGHRASAIFTADEKLMMKTMELGEKCSDYVWPLPLWEEFEDEVKGTFGDVANMGKYDRYGGAIIAATFLWQFTKEYPKDCPWLHIDIAPTMTSVDGDQLAKGAKGSPVYLLLSLLEEL